MPLTLFTEKLHKLLNYLRAGLSRVALFLALLLWVPLFLAPANANTASVFIVPFESIDKSGFVPENEQSHIDLIPADIAQYLDDNTPYNSKIMSEEDFVAKNVGEDFLYDKPQLVAKLAKENGVDDWAVVGRLYRPTPLFAYIQAKVVNVADGSVRDFLSVEFKGSDPILIQKGIDRLCQQIGSVITE